MRNRGEAGLSSTQLAVVMPALLFFILLVVQYGLWAHARQVATAAVVEAVDAGRVPGAPAGAAEDAARSFLSGAGNLSAVAVRVDEDTDRIRVRIGGRAPQLVPGFPWRVVVVADAPLERFVPAGERPR